MPRTADRARRLAFDVLRRVNGNAAYANLALADLLAERRLTSRDAAFATELVAGTCRAQGTYDLILAAAAGRPTTSLQPAVLDLLRLGTHQLLAMRVPAHAAVAATVDLAGATVGRRVTGLVNAVLRRVAEHDFDSWVERLDQGMGERDRLVVATAHPRWIVDAFADVLTEPEVEAALRADNDHAPVTLAVRPGLAEIGELTAGGAAPGRYSPYAARWSGNPADLSGRARGPGRGTGRGFALVRLAASPGSRLRLGRGWTCAPDRAARPPCWPGSPVPTSALVAAEVAPHRATLVRQAVRAYPVAPRPCWWPTEPVRHGGRAPSPGCWSTHRARAWARPPPAGVRWRRRPEDVEPLRRLQLALLASAIDSTHSGRRGRLRHLFTAPPGDRRRDRGGSGGADDVEVIPAGGLLPPSVEDGVTGDYVQLWPHRHGTDAMFAAYLRRRG